MYVGGEERKNIRRKKGVPPVQNCHCSWWLLNWRCVKCSLSNSKSCSLGPRLYFTIEALSRCKKSIVLTGTNFHEDREICLFLWEYLLWVKRERRKHFGLSICQIKEGKCRCQVEGINLKHGRL